MRRAVSRRTASSPRQVGPPKSIFLPPPPPAPLHQNLLANFARSLIFVFEPHERLWTLVAVQINAGTEMLEGEEFGDDNFDFDEDAADADDMDGI